VKKANITEYAAGRSTAEKTASGEKAREAGGSNNVKKANITEYAAGRFTAEKTASGEKAREPWQSVRKTPDESRRENDGSKYVESEEF
jgi:hypothetical protein